MPPERVAFVLVDGIGDVTIPQLGNRTPLQAADVPHLDAIAGGRRGAAQAAGGSHSGGPCSLLAARCLLSAIPGLPTRHHSIHSEIQPPRCTPSLPAAAAAAGLCGVMDPVEPGLACGSDTAHLSLFGYDPRTYYRGRGAFESMGAGVGLGRAGAGRVAEGAAEAEGLCTRHPLGFAPLDMQSHTASASALPVIPSSPPSQAWTWPLVTLPSSAILPRWIQSAAWCCAAGQTGALMIWGPCCAPRWTACACPASRRWGAGLGWAGWVEWVGRVGAGCFVEAGKLGSPCMPANPIIRLAHGTARPHPPTHHPPSLPAPPAARCERQVRDGAPLRRGGAGPRAVRPDWRH